MSHATDLLWPEIATHLGKLEPSKPFTQAQKSLLLRAVTVGDLDVEWSDDKEHCVVVGDVHLINRLVAVSGGRVPKAGTSLGTWPHRKVLPMVEDTERLAYIAISLDMFLTINREGKQIIAGNRWQLLKLLGTCKVPHAQG